MLMPSFASIEIRRLCRLDLPLLIHEITFEHNLYTMYTIHEQGAKSPRTSNGDTEWVKEWDMDQVQQTDTSVSKVGSKCANCANARGLQFSLSNEQTNATNSTHLIINV